MSWFVLEAMATGRPLSPVDAVPPGPLRLTLRGGLRLSRCDGATVRTEHDDDARASWVITPRGPFTLVLGHGSRSETALRIDAPLSDECIETPPPDDAPATIDTTPPVIDAPPATTDAAAPPEAPAVTNDAPLYRWTPRPLAMLLLTDTERFTRLDQLVQRVIACRARVAEAVGTQADGDLSAVTIRLAALTRETGRIPAWVSDPRAARTQRARFEAVAARAAAAAGVAPETEPPADGITRLLDAISARVAETSYPDAAEPDDALDHVAREMEALTAALEPFAVAVRALSASASLRGDVRAALDARSAIRAHGHRS